MIAVSNKNRSEASGHVACPGAGPGAPRTRCALPGTHQAFRKPGCATEFRCGLVTAGLKAGRGGLRGLFQPKCFHDSMVSPLGLSCRHHRPRHSPTSLTRGLWSRLAARCPVAQHSPGTAFSRLTPTPTKNKTRLGPLTPFSVASVLQELRAHPAPSSWWMHCTWLTRCPAWDTGWRARG